MVGAELYGIASEMRVVRFPELKKGGDVSDLIEQRRREGLDDRAIRAELAERFRHAPAWEPPRATSATEEWPEPVSLPEGLSPVADFDADLLPAKIAPWVNDISERMQCPPDYVAVTALVALGSVLGRKIGIAPQKNTDWFEVAEPMGLLCGSTRPHEDTGNR